MMPNDLEIPFDRVTFRDGQLLRARDLGDAARRDARLLGLHVRYLHETWGIAVGFEVGLAPGGQAVDVGPGYAVDEDGRGILLSDGIRVPVPISGTAESFVLTVGYQDDVAYRALGDSGELCLCEAGDPRHERPLFSWKRAEDVRFGPEIPVTQVVASGGTVLGSLDPRVRRNARRLARPYIAFGHTEPGETGWRVWRTESGSDLGSEATIDTSEAGFTKTPQYFALIQGNFNGLPLNPSELFSSDPKMPVPDPAFLLCSFGFVTDPQPDHFSYRVVLGRQFPIANAGLGPGQLEERHWSISWLGVEPRAGCVPTLAGSRLMSRLGELIRLRIPPQP